MLKVGALNACFLAKRGFDVEVFETREGSLQNSFWPTPTHKNPTFLDCFINGYIKTFCVFGYQISGKPKLWGEEALTWLYLTEAGKHWNMLE